MRKSELLDDIMAENLGYLKTSDVIGAGISKTYLREYVEKKGLERVAHGLYMAPDEWKDSMYIIQVRYPKAVFSHETALFLHNLTDREPLKYSVTMKLGAYTTQLTKEGIKVYKVKEELFELGLGQSQSSFGHSLRAYNPERTICDIIRSRSNVEIQTMQTALKEYVASKNRNLPLLMRIAKAFSVDKIIGRYLEVLL
jgi:predicted transcriptional regulator of viral defense system